MGLFSSLAGSAVSGLFGAIGNKKSSKQSQPAFARSEPVIYKPKPFSLDTIFGNTTGGQFTPTDDFQRGRYASGNLVANTGSQAEQADPRGFATRFLEAMNRVNDKREEQGFANFESKLFNRSGASTGTGRQIADFRNDLEDRRFQRGILAQQLGMQNQTSALNNFNLAMGGQQSLQRAQLNQTRAGFEGVRSENPFSLGQRTTQGGANNFAAQNTKNFWDGLGGTVGGAIDDGISAYNNPFVSSEPGGGFFNSGAINFGRNPI